MVLRREIALSPRTICATALLNVSARSARNRARTLAGGRCYSTGSTSDSGVAECLSARAARISGRGRRTAVAGGIVDANGRCARRCRRARSRVVASCRTVDLCPLRDVGRRTCNARPRRLVCGCASIRTQADPDSRTVITTNVKVIHPKEARLGTAIWVPRGRCFEGCGRISSPLHFPSIAVVVRDGRSHEWRQPCR
jgi:hypothetical protein